MKCDGIVYHNYKSDVPAANYYPMITKVDKLTEEEQKKQEVLQQVTVLCRHHLGAEVDDSLFMPRICQCRYYSGEKEGDAPFQSDQMNWFWRMERTYVNHLGEKFIGEGDYYETLCGKAYPGIPKDLLYMMFSYWTKGVCGVAESLPKFYELVDEYMEIPSDHIPKDKIPGELMPSTIHKG